MKKFIFQNDAMDCGPACLAMICSFFGKDIDLQYLRYESYITREGVSLLGISEAAKKVGLQSTAAKIKYEALDKKHLPCILHWNKNHFVVLYKISKSFFSGKLIYKIADPAHGFVSLSEQEFKKCWLVEDEKGIAFLLEPTEEFYKIEYKKEEDISFKYLLKYLKPHHKKMWQMFCLLLLGTLTTLFFPILTQKLIDEGVDKKNLSVVTYILLTQLAFFVGNMTFNIFRNWIVLEVGTKVNIQIISDFFKKLFKLPIKFFDTKLLGDFNQRIQDQERIEDFLTSQSLLTLFSIITFSVFFVILGYYNLNILIVYTALTVISIFWSLYWMKKRKILDYFRFQRKSENQESIYEIINGISEMKLNQFERFKLREWEKIQEKLLKINIRVLKLDQIQMSGFEFFNQLKNIIVTFLAASYVVKDNMTLGALLSVSYIIGQMNSPLSQLISFFRSSQDAKLSLSRLNEVQNHPTEEKDYFVGLDTNIKNYHVNSGINLVNVSFQYEGPRSPFVLKDINLFIPEGKITAIVGDSGSGKTTLLKILLKFYEQVDGEIYFNDLNIKEISPVDIRKNTGVVMQEGFIFSDTIERNIATGDEEIDAIQLEKALKIANIKTFVEQLPLGSKTKIGAAGNGISGGQKQRILIARAVYKNPHIILFDEATSALDAENEMIIHKNLQSFFRGKTVIIVAHRLSTVKNADQIIVLKNGEIVERGKHYELVEKKNNYYNLVKNQLELGN
ncbi:peptidase domain-containing ABC transporter [Chryseobacterium sp. RG1]|uniref:Peptidase domain-containing ABC transporter n=1 Tax=Chryseobacterium tagetis TaxID=2801334 RepID=A0ABS8A3G8_9FLAO|nr:peptidase domain-containing ABC transporter [Chryseobacterium tagetis]MCA6068397.1 peptidase domain-containing ABC transporter [Chryseobacterium tagetis]